jgi:hypothetical protein
MTMTRAATRAQQWNGFSLLESSFCSVRTLGLSLFPLAPSAGTQGWHASSVPPASPGGDGNLGRAASYCNFPNVMCK